MARKVKSSANYLDDEGSYARFSFEVRDFGTENRISFITINVREYHKGNRLVEIRILYSWSQVKSFFRSYGDELDKGEYEIISRFIRAQLPNFPKKSPEMPTKFSGPAVEIGDKALRTKALTRGNGSPQSGSGDDPPVPPVRRIRSKRGDPIPPFYEGFLGIFLGLGEA